MSRPDLRSARADAVIVGWVSPAALARAGEAARAFASVTIAPPDSLIAAIAADAGALVARAKAGVANV